MGVLKLFNNPAHSHKDAVVTFMPSECRVANLFTIVSGFCPASWNVLSSVATTGGFLRPPCVRIDYAIYLLSTLLDLGNAGSLQNRSMMPSEIDAETKKAWPTSAIYTQRPVMTLASGPW